PEFLPIASFGIRQFGQRFCAADAGETRIVLPLFHFKQHAISCSGGIQCEFLLPSLEIRLQPRKGLIAKPRSLNGTRFGAILALATPRERGGTGSAITVTHTPVFDEIGIDAESFIIETGGCDVELSARKLTKKAEIEVLLRAARPSFTAQ